MDFVKLITADKDRYTDIVKFIGLYELVKQSEYNNLEDLMKANRIHYTRVKY